MLTYFGAGVWFYARDTVPAGARRLPAVRRDRAAQRRGGGSVRAAPTAGLPAARAAEAPGPPPRGARARRPGGQGPGG